MVVAQSNRRQVSDLLNLQSKDAENENQDPKEENVGDAKGKAQYHGQNAQPEEKRLAIDAMSLSRSFIRPSSAIGSNGDSRLPLLANRYKLSRFFQVYPI